MRKLALGVAACGLILAAPAVAQTAAPTATAPTPPTAVGPAAPSAAAPARPRRVSWTSDRRDFAVGDIVTVLLDEYTLATANRGNAVTSRRSRDNSIAAGQSLVESIPDLRADFGSVNDAESRQTGAATRQSRFQGEMTVRVVEVGPDGLIRIEGTRMVNVDKSQEEMKLTGWVRAQDISPNNLVDSWRIADAQIEYTTKGLEKPHSSMLGRLLGALWP